MRRSSAPPAPPSNRRGQRSPSAERPAPAPTPAPALDTGIPTLDLVLGGGLPRAGLAAVVGPPGSGKTTLAQQVAFHRARAGDQVLFLTGFAESHEKLVALGRSLAFFDPAFLGTRIHLGSLPDLLQEGAAQAERDVLSTVREHGARLVVIDGFRGLGALLDADGATDRSGRFLYGLGAKLALLDASLLVLVEGESVDTACPPSLAVADVLVSLRSDVAAGRERRLLQVRKRRGARPLQGLHPYTVEASGVRLWPRFEATVPHIEAAWSSGRAGFHQPEIDALLRGGLTEGTITLAAGSFGTGKTLLGLHFAAEGARLGEPTLVLSLMESGAQLREKGRAFGLHIDEAEATGALRLVSVPSHDLEADAVTALLCEDAEARGVRRLVVDSVAQLERAVVEPARREGFFSALVTYLRGRSITTYMTYEVAHLGADLDLAGTPLAVLAENLLLLRAVEQEGRLLRLFSVMHMRFSDHDDGVHRYTIEAGRGIVLAGAAGAARRGAR